MSYLNCGENFKQGAISRIMLLMRKSFFLLTVAILFFVVPDYLFAKENEAQLTADTIAVRPNGEIYAEGNVTIRRGKIFIKSEALIINKKTKSIKLFKVEEFNDGNSIKISAKEANFDQELSAGLLAAVDIFLDETLTISADEVQLKNGKISKAKKIKRLTTCEVCDFKEPKWYFTASSATSDIENSNIVYRDVTLRIRGFPIGYLPYLRLPDPSVERARGFLVPQAVISSQLGTGLKLPYFIPMGQSRDLLIVPFVSPSTKTLGYRYREKFRSGELIVRGASSKDDITQDSSRFFYQAKGNFSLNYGLGLKFDFGQASDSSYLGDYSYISERNLDSQITLEKTYVDQERFFDGRLNYVREKEENISLKEYYSISGDYVNLIKQEILPGRFYLSAAANSSINVNQNRSFSRPPSSAHLALEYSKFDASGPFSISNQSFVKLNSFVNSADLGTTREEINIQYGSSIEVKSPRTRTKKNKTIKITPKVSIAFNGQENQISGDFFQVSDELSFGNLFLPKKFASLSDSETGFGLTLGLDYEILWGSKNKLSLSFGSLVLDSSTYEPNINSGLKPGYFSYLSAFEYKLTNDINYSGQALFSKDGKLVHGNVKGTHRIKNFGIQGNYEFYDDESDPRLNDDLKNFDFSSSFGFSEKFKMFIGGRFDITENAYATSSYGLKGSFGSWNYNFTQKYAKQKDELLTLSAIYDDECTRLTISFENRSVDFGLSDPIQTFMFRVQFKPFADLGFSQGFEENAPINSMF